MKKLIVLAMILSMLLGIFSMTVSATGAAESATVYVTIVTVEGESPKLALVQRAVTVTDIDHDGALTINDALYLAHEAKYAGGAAAGYAYSEGQYGLAIDKLWGVANGGSYGYCVNHVSAMGLADPIKDGDLVTAYIYAYGVCDTYAYFDQDVIRGEAGESVELMLYAVTYDLTTWQPVTAPIANAEILVDNVESSYKTNEAGKATIKLDNVGEHVISARKNGMGLVLPVCVTYVTDPESITPPPSGDSNEQISLPDITLPHTDDPSQISDDDGCGSVASGVGVFLTVLAVGFVIKRKDQDEI